MSMREMLGHVGKTETGRTQTPQNRAIPAEAHLQVKNAAGGFTYALDKWGRLRRFLILGTENGTFYISEGGLTRDNVECVEDCLIDDGLRVVREVVEVSASGRAFKNDQCLLVLALAMNCYAFGSGAADKAAIVALYTKTVENGIGRKVRRKLDEDTLMKRGLAVRAQDVRKAARDAVSKVARTGTHLFNLAEAVEGCGGWGPAKAKAFAKWYTSQEAEKLAYQVAKYQRRNGWSHVDILRLAHPKGLTPDKSPHGDVIRWVMGGGTPESREKPTRMSQVANKGATRILWGFEQAKVAETGEEIVRLITDYRLPRECIPTEWLNTPEVWEALLDNGGQGMPITALVRNLGKMTQVGLIKPLSSAARKVADMLGEKDRLAYGRIHPLRILIALRQYQSGGGNLGRLVWSPVDQVTNALDAAFYASFANVEPTGLNYLLGIDVSGSMRGAQAGYWTKARKGSGRGCPGGMHRVRPGYDWHGVITAAEGAACLALVTASVEPNHHIVAFDDTLKFPNISKGMRIDAATREIEKLIHGRTNCALPMSYAEQRKLDVDVHVIYTDGQTWQGDTHPSQALDRYNRKMGRRSRLVSVGLCAYVDTIARPDDPNMMSVVGFDTRVPEIIREFALAGRS